MIKNESPGIDSELKFWLLTLIFNLLKLNSAYSAIEKEGSYNQENMALQRKMYPVVQRVLNRNKA